MGLVDGGMSRVVCAFTTATTIVLGCSRSMLHEAMAAQVGSPPLCTQTRPRTAPSWKEDEETA